MDKEHYTCCRQNPYKAECYTATSNTQDLFKGDQHTGKIQATQKRRDQAKWRNPGWKEETS